MLAGSLWPEQQAHQITAVITAHYNLIHIKLFFWHGQCIIKNNWKNF